MTPVKFTLSDSEKKTCIELVSALDNPSNKHIICRPNIMRMEYMLDVLVHAKEKSRGWMGRHAMLITSSQKLVRCAIGKIKPQLPIKTNARVYASIFVTKNGAPAQVVHQDMGGRWGSRYWRVFVHVTTHRNQGRTEFWDPIKNYIFSHPGTVAFDGLQEHRGGANKSSKPRIALALMFIPIGQNDPNRQCDGSHWE